MERYGISALLALAFVTHGAKTPLEFFIFGSGVLGFCFWTYWTHSDCFTLSRFNKELILLVCLILSYGFSQDCAASLFRTLQFFVLLLLWTALKLNPAPLNDQTLFYDTLTATGLLTALMTCQQFFTGKWQTAFGFFPLNPVLNATWVSAVGISLLTSSLVIAGRRAPLRRITGIVLMLTALGGPARSILIALTLGFFYTAYFHISFKKVLIILGFLLVVVSAAPNRLLANRLRLNEGNYRTQIWKIAARGILAHPFTGWGFSNFEMIYQQFAFPVETDSIRFSRTTEFAHNEFLQIADDTGVFPLVIIVYGLICALLRPTASARIARRPAKAGLIVLTAVGAYNMSWHLPILVLLSLVWSASLLYENPACAANASARGITFKFVSVPVILCLEMLLGWCVVRESWAQDGQWQKILAVDSRDATAWRMWADQQKDLKAALIGYQHAVTFAPHQVYFHEAYARALEVSKATAPLAIDEYQNALHCAPSRSIDAVGIGRVLYRLGKPAAALEWFRRAQHTEPHYWECDLWIARCLFRLGDRSGAFWTLNHLQSRRNQYLNWRERVRWDLPSQNDSAIYDRAILTFDQSVIQRDIDFMRHQSAMP